MDKHEFKCLLISDFNMDNLAGYLNNDKEFPKVTSNPAPFGQVIQVLMGKSNERRLDNADFAVIWTQPQSVIESFNQVLNFEKVSLDKIISEVNYYCRVLIKAKDRVRFVFVPTWVVSFDYNPFAMLDMKPGFGITNILMQMNLQLSETLDKMSNIYILNTQKWITESGKNSFNPKLFYMAKIPFGNEVFKNAVKDIKSSLRGIIGYSKKMIVLDLDETLWGGIVGDIGWENIKLGGHDYVGEAYVDFQRALKSLKNRGILLGIVSKNDESIALETIKSHPEMVLKLEDFAGWKINWRDKAENLIDLVSDLNLDIESVVYIDDNPVERARIKRAIPEVSVPEWPKDQTLYKNRLLSLPFFNTPSISKEDLNRSKLYFTERKRKILKTKLGTLDEWLNSLDTKVIVEELNETNLQRTVQLLNKTNQMNLSTRRMTGSELLNWLKNDNHKLWTFRVSDKFGDSGLTGITSLEINGNDGKIVDFILSCRVMGRRVEETMLYYVITYSRCINLDKLYAILISTSKNKPCLDFWLRSGFVTVEDKCFSWDLKNEYPLPPVITLDERGSFRLN